MATNSLSQEYISNYSLSQEYIYHLRRKVRKAERAKRLREATRDNFRSFSDNANLWRDKLKVYFERVKATEEISEKVFKDIEKLAIQAQTVNSNIEQIVKAIKLLACNILRVSRSLDVLIQDYQSIKNDIDNAGMVSKNFKPNVFMAAFNTLGGDGGKLIKASIACSDAVVKALDLLKAIYLLHYSIDSSYSDNGDTCRIQWPLDELVRADEDRMIYTTLYEEPDTTLLGRKHNIPGLEWLLGKLIELLKTGLSQPDPDQGRNQFPCAITYRNSPRFPLKEGENRYYHETKDQYEEAEKEAIEAEDKLAQSQKDLQRVESSYIGLKAALDLAEAAKNQTKK